ncbi:DNA/RNA polymerase [Cryphonectria parasitica EP155]|uniref:DNA-directed RNA polymerase n=1 Tax=Cryphonectria parasitica (strain ATCC 38755 / EP155) TaxID=660469 RepID=A0A9P4Y4K8_CRYP1|nr:DNA/RNA polymerase [Cryphonectria parasitica EP155]KAF3766839.1 DNA/RNA polymerase [Cryphonectria parasitica EP155]
MPSTKHPDDDALLFFAVRFRTATTTTALYSAPNTTMAKTAFYSAGSYGSPLYAIRSFDPSTPMILPDPKPRPPPGRSTTSGVPGEIEVAVPVFEACVHVGKLERAALVLKRLEDIGVLDPEQLMSMNNQYLESWLRHIKSDPGIGKAEDMHAWYEVHIREPKLPQTPETIAYMLKASLLTTSPKGTRLNRLIKRYMGMVPTDQGLDVLYCTDILSDADIAAITKHYPEFNISSLEDDGAMYEARAEDATASIPADVTAADGSVVPEVLETPQKGSGLSTIKSTLEIFKQMRDGYDISTLPPSERREFQSRLETDCITAAMDRWREMDENLRKMGLNTAVSSTSISSRLWTWHQDLEQHLKDEFVEIEKAEKAVKKNEEELDRCVWGPVLMQSTPSRLAAITILTVLNSLAYTGVEKGVSLSIIINHLSRTAEEDIQATRSRRERLRTWPVALRSKVGAALLSALTKVAKVRVVRDHPETNEKVSSMQPAFSHNYQFRRGRKIGVLMVHPVFAETMRKEPRADFLARHLPMVVEPQPWSKFDKGGYIDSPVALLRMKSGEQDQRLYAEAALAQGDLEQVLKGLDVLGKTAWRINRPVFNVLLEAWNTGEAFAKIPPLHPDLHAPEEPEASADPLARRAWQKALKQAHNQKMSYHSIRCYMNFQLEIARAFRDQEFFFPHNVDFRGRAYPIPTYLNHMGADHVRGLLRFSKGRELGERGLMWLKVHLANVYGYDKASLKDREAFAMENLTNIYDSANNPLQGKRWWLKAEDPWQCLATCFELKAALDSPDPTKFVSTMPIHQDGTCNGLQHYAALGGDSWGARQVNLAPGEKPADVYSAVADLVRADVVQDAKLGNPIAKAFEDKIKRKVVKQTVMTNVYGVTFTGAKKQVLKQIDALYPTFERDTGIQSGLVSSYITQKIFKALSTMFKGAHDIQYWLGEIGGRVCRALTAEQLDQIANNTTNLQQGSSRAKDIVTKKDLLELCRSTIVWTTPLRMPVVQPYRKNSSKVVKTCMQSLILQNPDHFDPVNRRKQLQAFPPNFIHSLDASHMLLSALECNELGLSFAAVHDSFWTHAADIDVMNRVLRDAFIRIHGENVIERLLSEFEARYRGGLYMAQIDPSSPAGKAITKWRKGLKKRLTGKDELLLEKQRLELLNSEDETERQKGEAMVTPASIYGQFASESGADVLQEDLSGTALGSLSASPIAEADEADIDEGAAPDADAIGAEEGDIHAPVELQAEMPVTVWLPLSFPAVPKKGDFDVNELRESDYFFS